jgi:methyltransferase-like protein
MYASYIDGEQEDGDPKSDSALLHDELEELNQPIYFYEFVDRVERHGLQYLGELLHQSAGNHSSEKLENLRRWSRSLVELEQSSDFLFNRTFRQTLVCHQEIKINRKVTPARVQDFYLASGAQPVSSTPDITGPSVEGFRIGSGATFSTDHPLTKAAMMCLAEAWPRPVKFSDLESAARQRLGSTMPEDEDQHLGQPEESRILSINLLKAFDYSRDLVELHTYAPRISSRPSEKPAGSQWAVMQAQEQGWVTNLRHERVELDEFDRFLLTLLDGRHDRPALIDLLITGPVAEGLLTLETEDKALSPQEQRALLAEEVELRLKWLAKAALIIDETRSGDEVYGTRKSD